MLAQHCVAGMQPRTEQAVFELSAGDQRRQELQIADASRCIRVLAASGAGRASLLTSLTSADGRSWQSEQPGDGLALLPESGPLCPGASHLTASVRVTSGSAAVALQVWQGP